MRGNELTWVYATTCVMIVVSLFVFTRQNGMLFSFILVYVTLQSYVILKCIRSEFSQTEKKQKELEELMSNIRESLSRSH